MGVEGEISSAEGESQITDHRNELEAHVVSYVVPETLQPTIGESGSEQPICGPENSGEQNVEIEDAKDPESEDQRKVQMAGWERLKHPKGLIVTYLGSLSTSGKSALADYKCFIKSVRYQQLL